MFVCSYFPYRATSSSELFITLPGMGEWGDMHESPGRLTWHRTRRHLVVFPPQNQPCFHILKMCTVQQSVGPIQSQQKGRRFPQPSSRCIIHRNLLSFLVPGWRFCRYLRINLSILLCLNHIDVSDLSP